MKLNSFKSLPLSIVLCIILLPWISILGFVSNMVTLFTFLFVIIGIAGLGSLVLKGISTPHAREDKAFLALPTGFLTASCLIALGVRLGISPPVIFSIVTLLAVVGLTRIIPYRESVSDIQLPDSWGLIALSLIIALVYFLPGAIRDAVYLPDGSYNWMYVDTQYHCAIATSVKSCIGTPKLPDMGVTDLRYHFGPDAIAGAISAALGIPVGDAVARIVRPTALLSLLFASYSLGRLLARMPGRENTCGILAAAGLFFYGSLASLFANNVNSASLVSGAILFELPYVSVPSSGGPFSHLILGGSELHGLSGLFVLLTLFLAKLKVSDERYLGPDLLSFGPAALFPTSLLLGIAYAGLTTLLLLWFGSRNKRAWFNLAVVACTSIFSVWAMGYIGSPMTARTEFEPVRFMTEGLFEFFVWFYIGLGIRQYAFSRMKNPLRDPVSAALIILFVGFVSLSLLFRDHYWGNTRYGLLFAQATFSVFSFAWLSEPTRMALRNNWSELSSAVTDLLRVILLSGIAFFTCAVFSYLLIELSDNSRFSVVMTIKAAFVIILVSAASLVLFLKVKNLQSVLSGLVAGICFLGFAAWVADWVNYGLGRMRMDVTISKGEALGLASLRNVSKKGDMVATNQHALPGFRRGSERSYAYGTLSERTMLLEGWKSGGADNHPLFEQIKQANDLLFSTTDEGVARNVIRDFNIRFVVAKPETDIALAKSLPNWLSLIPDTGTLKVYKVMN